MLLKILNGTWLIKAQDGVFDIEGTVPGSLFQALESCGEFGEEGIFFRENNREAVDLADRDILFRRNFELDKALLAEPFLFLEADGLDTLAEITVNGKPVGRADNMHRRWRFPVDGLLVAGTNTIEILFRNSLEYIRGERRRRSLFASDGGGEVSVPGFNAIRKSHCSYGWDWGPKVPDVGIWREIRIAGYRTARLDSVHVTQEHGGEDVRLQLKPEVDMFGSEDAKEAGLLLEAVLTAPDGTIGRHRFPAGEASEILVENPQLWWPNGMGGQPLYRLDFRLLTGDGEAVSVEDEKSMKIGLRMLTIEQKPDEWGETFQFNCNGVPVFSRGANYIPEDVFLNRDDPYSRKELIEDCVRANYNTIRVWGGGVYPDDEFYTLCDRYGLIVWQDLMFACALYDVKNEVFFSNMIAEVRDNLKRIRHHASIGLICGNNEMEMAFEDWNIDPTKEQRVEYLKQYQFVFPEIISEVCPEHFYWPASPSSGGNFEQPNDPDRGDCHFWAVWHGNKDFDEFRKHYFRFMSEFGFESFPSMKTIRSFALEEDLNPFSPVLEEHQKCPGGNGKILNYIARYFRYPKDTDALVYVSQLSQAEAVIAGVEHWRRNRGRCMGSLYWQVNDNWPVASWSSIDYYGRWKALHYAAKRAYDNLLVSITDEGGMTEIHLSNEGLSPVSGQINWKLSDFSGRVLEEGTGEAFCGAQESRVVFQGDFTKLLSGIRVREVYFSCSFQENSGRIFRGAHYYTFFKQLSLQKPELGVKVVEEADGLTVVITAVRPALFIEVDTTGKDAVFADNYFSMDGGETRRIRVEKGDFSAGELRNTLKLRSLVDSY